MPKDKLDGVVGREWRVKESHGNIEGIGFESAFGLVGCVGTHVFLVFTDFDGFAVEEHTDYVGGIRIKVGEGKKEFSGCTGA